MRTLKDTILEETYCDIRQVIDNEGKEQVIEQILDRASRYPDLSLVDPEHHKYTYTENFIQEMHEIHFITLYNKFTVLSTYDDSQKSYKLTLSE